MPHPLPRHGLADRVASAIREEIAAGTWRSVLPGERTLGTTLGVSRPVVRSALRMLEAQKLVRIAHGQPTLILARRMDPARVGANRVCLLSPVPLHETPPLTVYWIHKLGSRLSAAGRRMEHIVSHRAFSSRPARALSELTAAHPEATWILFRSHAAVQRWFHQHRLPCVVAGSAAKDIPLPSVDLDYRAICRHAAGLLKARGCRRVALVLPDGNAPGDAESERGFLEAFTSDEIQRTRVLRHEGTEATIDRVIGLALDELQTPDAFIVARSAHALTALTSLLRRGLRVPADIALVSRDDDAFLNHTIPSVARYRSDPDAWAARINRLVGKLAEDPAPKVKPLRLMPEFMRGQTVP